MGYASAELSGFYLSLTCRISALGFQFDYVFDWTILKHQQSQIPTPPARAVVSGVFSWFVIGCMRFDSLAVYQVKFVWCRVKVL